MSKRRVVWSPQHKQRVFMGRGEYEGLYGGAAGGGKSEALVLEALRQVQIPHYKGLILRKTYPELGELIDKSLGYYPGLPWGQIQYQRAHLDLSQRGAGDLRLHAAHQGPHQIPRPRLRLYRL